MNILLVDDDKTGREWIAMFLRQLGHHVLECANGEEALTAFKTMDFGMILSDIKMPKMSGLELLKTISAMPSRPNADIVLFTGHGDMESAIHALRAGAYDYLLKPINMDELAVLTERIAEHQNLLRENRRLSNHFDSEVKAATEETQRELSQLKTIMAKQFGIGNIGVFSESMRQIVDQAYKYHTERSIPVLIQGETGTGKEIIAKMIHYGKDTHPAPYVDINCAAFTSSLFESELFGYEAGAFTGGLTKGQKGKLDMAAGGTLFLDEIGEMPLELQSKLLRVLQEKTYYRVGGVKKLTTDVRIVCATNEDLSDMVSNGSFRKDLYYRLKVGHIVLPPLRERSDEILPLATIFLKEFTQLRRKRFTAISAAAADILRSYPWPGNIRELRNVVEWITFMYDDVEVRPEHLGAINKNEQTAEVSPKVSPLVINPDNFILPAEKFDLKEFTDKVIYKALEIKNGNKTDAANYLNMSRRALCYKLEQDIKDS
ncbi:sigma-54-dependent transcriptional regulator [Sporomusa aerivorans]|uniref:sigma-54-dependent transcriptional regulator n=1 Tax=Sporomusa aerivorans TaxID=204936 RepID=UPI00352B1510